MAGCVCSISHYEVLFEETSISAKIQSAHKPRERAEGDIRSPVRKGLNFGHDENEIDSAVEMIYVLP